MAEAYKERNQPDCGEFLARAAIVLLVLHGWIPSGAAGEQSFRGPGRIALVPAKCGEQSTRCLVLESVAQRAVQYDIETFQELRSSDLPDTPRALVVDPTGERCYVALGDEDGRVLEIGLPDMEVVRSLDVGHTPTDLAIADDGQRVFVANRFDGTIDVVDCEQWKVVASWDAGREPVALALVDLGRALLVGCQQPEEPADQFYTGVSTYLIDIESGERTPIHLPNGSHGLRDVAASPDGRYAYVTHLSGNYELVPSQIYDGWINSNSLTVISIEERCFLNTIRLDQPGLGAGNPWEIAISPDGRRMVIAHAGTSEISIINLPKLHEHLIDGIVSHIANGVPGADGERIELRRRVTIPLKGVRHLVATNDAVLLTAYFSGAVAQIELTDDMFNADGVTVGPIEGPGYMYETPKWTRDVDPSVQPLSDPSTLDLVMRGEMIFHDAKRCLEGWQSCASCHPDGRADGFNWDLMNDGVGNPKNTKSLIGSHATPPAMATGVRDSAETAVRAGFHHILFKNIDEDDAEAVDAYLESLSPVTSPHLENAELSDSARRGKRLFQGPKTGCSTCHPAPHFTDLRSHDVGTKTPRDIRSKFDTPTLLEAWRTGPYLHDGRYTTIRQLLIDGRHGDTGGRLQRLTEQQMGDLIEYVLSL